jgi:hypothetical protein
MLTVLCEALWTKLLKSLFSHWCTSFFSQNIKCFKEILHSAAVLAEKNEFSPLFLCARGREVFEAIRDYLEYSLANIFGCPAHKVDLNV